MRPSPFLILLIVIYTVLTITRPAGQSVIFLDSFDYQMLMGQLRSRPILRDCYGITGTLSIDLLTPNFP